MTRDIHFAVAERTFAPVQVDADQTGEAKAVLAEIQVHFRERAYSRRVLQSAAVAGAQPAGIRRIRDRADDDYLQFFAFVHVSMLRYQMSTERVTRRQRAQEDVSGG